MTLEQFAARAKDIVGDVYLVVKVGLVFEDDKQWHYTYQVFTDEIGWIGMLPRCEDPELVLLALAERRRETGKTDPSEVLHVEAS